MMRMTWTTWTTQTSADDVDNVDNADDVIQCGRRGRCDTMWTMQTMWYDVDDVVTRMMWMTWSRGWCERRGRCGWWMWMTRMTRTTWGRRTTGMTDDRDDSPNNNACIVVWDHNVSHFFTSSFLFTNYMFYKLDTTSSKYICTLV